jgi:hypothetical protein
VTPLQLGSWDKVSIIDAGHFDLQTAYIAVNSIRKNDMRPHIFKTRDGGKTWEEIVKGMHNMGPVNVVREDPYQPGLLFAETEREVYFSADDGSNWQSLRQNMPASSIRDLVIHDDDLVIGTHGRSIWILDNIAPLRELTSVNKQKPFLFSPPTAYRVRFNMFSDTPMPPEEPAGQNPPDGAIIDYYLPNQAQIVMVQIFTDRGDLVRTYRNDDKPLVVDSTSLPHPTYWIRPEQVLSAESGHRRFVWDMRYQPPADARFSYPISAVYRNTAAVPKGPLAHPGKYRVRLTVDGEVMETVFELKADPRSQASPQDLEMQREYAMRSHSAYLELAEMKSRMDEQLQQSSRGRTQQVLDRGRSLRGQGAPGEVDVLYGRITQAPLERESIVSLQEKFLYMISVIQEADVTPTGPAKEAIAQLEYRKNELLALCKQWLAGLR